MLNRSRSKYLHAAAEQTESQNDYPVNDLEILVEWYLIILE